MGVRRALAVSPAEARTWDHRGATAASQGFLGLGSP